jgi:thiosulfate/3-mercaptopyruvate sulfurtransferase
MPYTTLIQTSELAALAGSPTLVVVDCRFALDDVEWGQREYVARHIPGAVYAHIDHDLSGATDGTNGRHPLPDPDELRNTFSRLGISSDVQVVAYDQDTGMYASRLWWLLRWMGHDAVAVVDGGFAKWLAEGRPTSSGDVRNTHREFAGSPRAELLVDAEAVAGLSSNADWRLVDARAPERFRGEVEPLDKVAGHIPGAVNHFYKHNLDEHGTWRHPDELRRMLEKFAGDVPRDHVVCYCGSGVTACHNVLALEHAGFRGAKLYAGSWSEWSSDPSRPIARGE